MKGYDKCLACGEDTSNKKYCNDNCRKKYDYHNKPEQTIIKKEKRKAIDKQKRLSKWAQIEMERVNQIKALRDAIKNNL